MTRCVLENWRSRGVSMTWSQVGLSDLSATSYPCQGHELVHKPLGDPDLICWTARWMFLQAPYVCPGSWAKVLMSPNWWESAATWPHLWSRRLADHRGVLNVWVWFVPLWTRIQVLFNSISTNLIPSQSLTCVCVCLRCWIGAAAKLAFSVCIYSCNFWIFLVYLQNPQSAKALAVETMALRSKSKFLMNTPQTTWSVQPSYVWAGVWWTDTIHPAPGEHRAELHACLQKLLCLQGQEKNELELLSWPFGKDPPPKLQTGTSRLYLLIFI